MKEAAAVKTYSEANTQPVACWHVGDYCRLRSNLKRGTCDLWPQPRADRWFKKSGLHKGARVQFCVSNRIKDKSLGGLMVANGTIASELQPCILPEDPVFPMYVKIKDVEWLGPPLEHCPCYQANPQFGSHRLGVKALFIIIDN